MNCWNLLHSCTRRVVKCRFCVTLPVTKTRTFKTGLINSCISREESVKLQ